MLLYHGFNSIYLDFVTDIIVILSSVIFRYLSRCTSQMTTVVGRPRLHRPTNIAFTAMISGSNMSFHGIVQQPFLVIVYSPLCSPRHLCPQTQYTLNTDAITEETSFEFNEPLYPIPRRKITTNFVIANVGTVWN